MAESTTRFSDRVQNYIRYRPGYPDEVVGMLRDRCGLDSESVVADIGSGTGISAHLFLENGNWVIGVEPNEPMRAAAEEWLGGNSRFRSVAGTAEATGLADDAADFVVAGQAFHWFDRERCRQEFERILRPRGWVVLMWNERQTAATPFLEAYEALLSACGTDYTRVNHTNITDDDIDRFYAPSHCERWSMPTGQRFDLEGIRGRALSSSYTPNAGQPGYETFIKQLDDCFATHAEGGEVEFLYDTKIYYGQFR